VTPTLKSRVPDTSQDQERVIATAPNTFAAGWNARCDNRPFDRKSSAEWKNGWKLADGCDSRGRVPFNGYHTDSRSKLHSIR
jgi:hypothetical protein